MVQRKVFLKWGLVINTLTTMGAVHVRKSFIDKEPNVVKQLV